MTLAFQCGRRACATWALTYIVEVIVCNIYRYYMNISLCVCIRMCLKVLAKLVFVFNARYGVVAATKAARKAYSG